MQALTLGIKQISPNTYTNLPLPILKQPHLENTQLPRIDKLAPSSLRYNDERSYEHAIKWLTITTQNRETLYKNNSITLPRLYLITSHSSSLPLREYFLIHTITISVRIALILEFIWNRNTNNKMVLDTIA